MHILLAYNSAIVRWSIYFRITHLWWSPRHLTTTMMFIATPSVISVHYNNNHFRRSKLPCSLSEYYSVSSNRNCMISTITHIMTTIFKAPRVWMCDPLLPLTYREMLNYICGTNLKQLINFPVIEAFYYDDLRVNSSLHVVHYTPLTYKCIKTNICLEVTLTYHSEQVSMIGRDVRRLIKIDYLLGKSDIVCLHMIEGGRRRMKKLRTLHSSRIYYYFFKSTITFPSHGQINHNFTVAQQIVQTYRKENMLTIWHKCHSHFGVDRKLNIFKINCLDHIDFRI